MHTRTHVHAMVKGRTQYQVLVPYKEHSSIHVDSVLLRFRLDYGKFSGEFLSNFVESLVASVGSQEEAVYRQETRSNVQPCSTEPEGSPP